MRVSREQAAANRERIIDAAASLFRAKGFTGIGVADIMKAADLTHGGFYGHFTSKDDLVAQASRRTMARSAANWTRVVAQGAAIHAHGERLLGREVARLRLGEPVQAVVINVMHTGDYMTLTSDA